jgi:hypothetical protein
VDLLTGVAAREYGSSVRRLRSLSEGECYARCYGDGDENVRFVKLEPRRPRYDTSVSGEDLRRAFEVRLDAREPPVEAERTKPAAAA